MTPADREALRSIERLLVHVACVGIDPTAPDDAYETPRIRCGDVRDARRAYHVVERLIREGA